ncbi:hypothetical protein Tco_0009203 [Tanacetum coccineum]
MEPKQKGSGGVLKKLDHIMGNIEFCDAYKDAYVVFQPYRISDHSPSILKVLGLISNKPKPFKFYNYLTYKPSFLDVVATYWNGNVDDHKMFRVVSKLKALKKPLRKRVYNTGHIHERVIKLRHELDEVQKALDANPEDLILREEEATYLQAFNEAKLDEERFLKQKAKIDNVIQNEQNAEFEGSQVAEAFVSHYENFLGSSTPYDNLNMEGLFQNKVFDMFNSSMVRTVSDLEIKEAMFDIGDDCGPGPDGFTTAFFKKNLGTLLVWRDCKVLVESAKNIISDWKNKSLSFAGRLQLSWYDTWDHQCLLINWLSPRDIASVGFHIKSLVAELILNGDWFWPHVWLRKAPNLNQIRVPILATNSQDATYWRDLNGKQFEFLVKCAWEVWLFIRHLANMEAINPTLQDILTHLQPIARQRTASSIVGKLLLATSSYYIWTRDCVEVRQYAVFNSSSALVKWPDYFESISLHKGTTCKLDSSVIVIDPDDQPMWSSTRTVASTPSSAIVQLPTSNNFHIKDDPTQGILIVGGIFLYNTPNEAFKILDDKVVELERQINQGLRNRQLIIENLERQFKYLEKIQQTKSFPHTTNTKPRHEIVYKPPSIRNANDKGDVKSIEEHEIKPTPTMPKPNLINSNSPTVSPFHKDCTVHISYTNAKTFADDVLPNHAGDKKLKSTDGVGTGRMTKKKIKKDEMGMPKGPNKEWKLNEKVVPHNKEVYHYQWHPTEVIHLNRNGEGGCLEQESIDLTRLC